MSNVLLSYELLYLMAWLLKNDKRRLKLLIKQAINNGLGSELDQIQNSLHLRPNEELQGQFLDFIEYLEDTLIDCLDKADMNKNIQTNLLSSLSKINTHHVSHNTLMQSLKQAEVELSHKKASAVESKNVLLKKLLKNWEPETEDVN